MRTTTRRMIGVLGLIALAPLTLSGCSFELVRESPPPTASLDSSAAPQSSKEAEAPVESRADYEASVTATLTCSGGELEISNSAEVVSLTDPCGQLTVSALGAVVLADSVETLVVSGDGNTIFVSEVTTVTLSGIGNSVYWRDGAPQVLDEGTANTTLKGN